MLVSGQVPSVPVQVLLVRHHHIVRMGGSCGFSPAAPGGNVDAQGWTSHTKYGPKHSRLELSYQKIFKRSKTWQAAGISHVCRFVGSLMLFSDSAGDWYQHP
jgi:hypothetical protein